MLWRPENRALRALLWLVIILVPGGLILFALLAAEAVQRRAREASATANEPALTDAALSPVGSSRS